MLNGLDPIIIFQFSKLAPSLSETVAKIPVISGIPTVIPMPPIPIYFSKDLAGITGIYIDTEDKNVDIQTDTETNTDGSPPSVDQKGIASTVSINIVGKKDSVGLSLLSALIDQVFDKVTSKEYAISYLHGAITIFGGKLHSFAVAQNANSELLTVKIELSKGEKQPTKTPEIPTVQPSTGLVPLS